MNSKTEFYFVLDDNFADEVICEKRPVLLLCMPRDERFEQQMTIVTETARKYAADLKICLLQESFIDVFKRKYGVLGTPTFLIFHKGKEKNRLLGLADEATLQALITEACQLPTK